jgi:hypothetical protein
LLRAPSKRKLKSQLKQKRKLFQDSEQEQLIDEMVELIPTVMEKLQKEKLVVDFCQLLRLIREEKLPFYWLLSFLFDGALSNFVDDGRRFSSFLRFGVDMWLVFFFFGLCSQSILDFHFVPLFLKQNKE